MYTGNDLSSPIMKNCDMAEKHAKALQNTLLKKVKLTQDIFSFFMAFYAVIN